MDAAPAELTLVCGEDIYLLGSFIYTFSMLFLAENFIAVPVVSLQTGATLAQTSQAVIDPRNLQIIAFYLDGARLDYSPALLLVKDIREVSDLGFLIDSSEEIISPEDMFSLQDILNLQFQLEGKTVVDTTGKKLGKVINYNVDSNSFFIQQLSVQRPFLQNLTNAELLIRRTQVTGVTDTTITVRAATSPLAVERKATIFSNPFTSSEPKPES